MEMKLGKRSPVYDRRDFLFSTYQTKAKLPSRPTDFGHENMIKEWQMLGNDKVGNCVFAGGGHEHMIWSAEGGKTVAFTDQGVLADYAAVTGYNPEDPASDQGTVVREALNYRRHTGLIDARNERHKIEAYVSLKPGDPDELLNALYLFGAVGIGLQLPESAIALFKAGKPWSIIPGSRTDGGHYVPVVAYRKKMVYVVTWGKLQPMTMQFYKLYGDESWAMLSPEMLRDGKTLEGFNLEQLRADLAEL